MDTNDKLKIGVVVVFGILIIYIIFRVLGKIGLVKSRETKQEEQAVQKLTSLEYFNPMFYKGKAFKPLGKAIADKYADDLHDAMSGFGTDEEKIFATFSNFKNKVNISEVAESYYQKFGDDLKTDILNELNDADKKKLMLFIGNLPNF